MQDHNAVSCRKQNKTKYKEKQKQTTKTPLFRYMHLYADIFKGKYFCV